MTVGAGIDALRGLGCSTGRAGPVSGAGGVRVSLRRWTGGAGAGAFRNSDGGGGRPAGAVGPAAVGAVGDVTLVSWDAGWLRRADVRVRAAALVAGVGSSRGVVSMVSPYLDQVGVRVEGVTVIESRARPGEPFSVRLEDDPVRRSSSGGLGRLLFMTAVALTAGVRD